MSFFDVRFGTKTASVWKGMQPPKLTWRSVITDLRWHNRLYIINRLRFGIRCQFLILRILQLVAYYFGWKRGQPDENRR